MSLFNIHVVEAVGSISLSNHAVKITILVSKCNLGQFRE